MTAWFIKRPVLVCMILLGACLLGAISYTRLPVELLPSTELPILFVQVNSSQADPHYLESQAIIPLESAIASLEDIELIETYIQPGQATIAVSYQPHNNQKYAYLKLQERITSARTQLGENFFVQVWKIDMQQLNNRFMTLQARGAGRLDQIRRVVDEKALGELENLDGIASVTVRGGRTRSIEVHLDQAALDQYDLTTSQIAARIRASSRSRRFLGQVVDGPDQYFVNLTTDYASLSALGETVIRPEGPLLLRQIATMVDGGAQRQTIARINSQEAISIALMRDRQTNLLDLSATTRKRIAQLNKDMAAHGVELAIQNDEAEAIEENITTIKELALIGSLLAVAVLWAFLRNLALVFIVAASIPISVLISLNLFYAFDITLNTLSLVGIAIAIGMLLDNSIVVLENIYRQRARGHSAQEAVIAGVGEVWRAVGSSTLTTICVFLPFIFAENFLVESLGRQVGISIISTLLVSLAVAFLLIPVFTSRLFKYQPTHLDLHQVSQRVRLLQIYTLLLKSCLRFPARTLIVATVAFFLSILLCLVVSINAGLEVELDRFELFATLPGGTTLEQADKQAINMDQRLAEIAELSQRRIDIQEDNLHFDFQLEEDFENIAHRNLASIRKEVRDKLKQAYARIHFSDTAPRRSGNLGGGNRGPVRAFQRLLGIGGSGERILLHGHDLAQLQRLGDDIRFNLEGLPGIERASLNVAPRQPQIDLHFDRNALAHFAITPQDIAAELSAFQPQTSTGVRLKNGKDEIDILLKSSDQHERRVDDLRHLQIPASGGAMALPRLADLVFTRGYGHIARVNQEKETEINLNFSTAVTASQELLETTRTSVDRLIADMVLPAGISVEVQHDESELEIFYFLIGAAILLIYMILTSAFESLVAPLAMMITLPLATIGAFWGLILTGNSIFNANALIGFLILLGVVVNNGIILIDYARLLQRRGYRLSRALITAGQVRVRPILITAISTILAMLPLAMGHAEYVARIGAPFAITVIGGLVAGTLFTLVLVPTVYFGLVSVLNWVGRLNWQTNTLQGLGLVGGLGLVYNHIDSTFWQFANGTVLLGLVPALTYFLQHSLRRSQAQLIPVDTPIHISIRNVVKVYDDHGRFARQWRRGERQAQNEPTTSARDPHLAWKIPLGIFLFYFTYIYLKSAVWPALFSIVSTTLVLHLLQALLRRRWSSYAYHLIFWLSPLPSLFWLFQRWGEPAPAIILGAFWYVGLVLHAAAQRLHNDRTKLNQGRFRRTRQVFYKLVARIPVIGRRKKPFAALNQVSMEISSGMFGLIGPNGAGKTTLMRIICGIFEQSRGVVEVNKFNLRTYGEELQGLIGYLPQEFGTYENMSAARFLDYQAMLKGIWDAQERRAIVDKVIHAVHLEDSRERKIGGFSGGMKQRVGIAQTLLHLPRILVVDEPTAGLDPRERIRFRNLLSELARDRVVIFSTHIIEDISSSCNRLAVLNGGEVSFLGSPQEMVELTRGAVWQAEVSPAHFDELRRHHRVVHHMQDGATIRVRMLAEAPPLPEAEAVAPTLEDSYLWLLKD